MTETQVQKNQTYREKLAAQRYKIEQAMAAEDSETKAEWCNTTTTVRKALSVGEPLQFSVNGVDYDLFIDEVSWAGEQFIASARLIEFSDGEEFEASVTIGEMPVRLAESAFVNVDNLTPFQFQDATKVRLILYVNQKTTLI